MLRLGLGLKVPSPPNNLNPDFREWKASFWRLFEGEGTIGQSIPAPIFLGTSWLQSMEILGGVWYTVTGRATIRMCFLHRACAVIGNDSGSNGRSTEKPN